MFKQKITTLYVLIFVIALGVNAQENCAGFEIKKDQNSNYFNLIKTNDLGYATYEYDLGDGRKKALYGDTTKVYYPFKGDYTITLIAQKENETCQVKQNISIVEDDTEYESKFELVWSDEFNQAEIDTNVWNFETGATGWGNRELQNYTNGENSKIEDGKLVITARKVGQRQKRGDYTSSRMTTKGKKEFQYGRFEIRAKVPQGLGLWSAIWMLGSNFPDMMWPHCGEIDILEYVGYDTTLVHSAIHNFSSFGNTKNKETIQVPDVETEFHNYGIIWDKYKISFYLDNPENVYYSYNPEIKDTNTWPHDQPFFFILNVAVGGNWGGKKGVDDSIFPKDFLIDYVRVYQNLEF